MLCLYVTYIRSDPGKFNKKSEDLEKLRLEFEVEVDTKPDISAAMKGLEKNLVKLQVFKKKVGRHVVATMKMHADEVSLAVLSLVYDVRTHVTLCIFLS